MTDTIAVLPGTNPLLKLIIRGTDSCLFINEMTFRRIRDTQLFGFVDWLRCTPGTIVGVRIWPHGEFSQLQRLLAGVGGGHCVFDEHSLTVKFTADDFDENISDDHSLADCEVWICDLQVCITVSLDFLKPQDRASLAILEKYSS